MGSSPLARGLPVGQCLGPFRDRIIPARAGFTQHPTPSRSRASDHPRSRGVYAPYMVVCFSRHGSSPLARGLPLQARRGPVQGGIIPARAGFTPSASRPHSGGPDHPRSRGVYSLPRFSCDTRSGSSPLARGLLKLILKLDRDVRIIPARAGFTCSSVNPGRRASDHPRSRGVYLLVGQPRQAGLGSSPLARGLRNHCGMAEFRNRIIPARAGFTAGLSVPSDVCQDHPRSRGVYLGPLRNLPGLAGSSPLARGLHRYRRRRRLPRRIIPARAGFTPAGLAPARAGADHPRSRGVYRGQVLVEPHGHGSSPLARGLPWVVTRTSIAAGDHPRSRGVYVAGGSHEAPRGGIIPARAGFTRATAPLGRGAGDHPRSRGVYHVALYG